MNVVFENYLDKKKKMLITLRQILSHLNLIIRVHF